ncbi:hypothetical protein [Vagococcus silagei]|uniref:Uncharacterized protein n=1 Tax=Vagococcus silagei TaxID=2508885 RepID=A0A4S3B5Q7_9ENTE|nr:hypothetical protein [Vagococcus silagei]THB62421.1 hypothetical protein ESZ54_01005 [Vagococcus silagei]
MTVQKKIQKEQIKLNLIRCVMFFVFLLLLGLIAPEAFGSDNQILIIILLVIMVVTVVGEVFYTQYKIKKFITIKKENVTDEKLQAEFGPKFSQVVTSYVFWLVYGNMLIYFENGWNWRSMSFFSIGMLTLLVILVLLKRKKW